MWGGKVRKKEQGENETEQKNRVNANTRMGTRDAERHTGG